MESPKEFEDYLAHLAQGLGHADRHAGLAGYCTGLMLPLSRKSVEPMAARVDPLHASAKHPSLHHFVAKAQWSDEQVLRLVTQWAVPHMDMSKGGFWIMDDTTCATSGNAHASALGQTNRVAGGCCLAGSLHTSMEISGRQAAARV